MNGPGGSVRESILAADKVVIACQNPVEEGALDLSQMRSRCPVGLSRPLPWHL